MCSALAIAAARTARPPSIAFARSIRGFSEAVGRWSSPAWPQSYTESSCTEFVEQPVPLHLQQLVTVLGLLNSSLEFDELAAGWFDVECHSSFPSSF